MKKISSFIILSITLSSILASCSMISSSYLPSSGIQRQSVPENSVQVFYDKEDVDFKYKEIGRVFLKNINYWADRDPAGQISKIKQEAAICGADAVIIVAGMRQESSFGAFNNSASGNAGDVYQYSGIAIIRE